MAFFTSNLHEARWQQTIHLEGQPQHTAPLAKLLGVTLDRTLAFWQHIANITFNVAGRCRVLTLLTSKQRGWRKDKLTEIYNALYLSVLMYVVASMYDSPVWNRWNAVKTAHFE